MKNRWSFIRYFSGRQRALQASGEDSERRAAGEVRAHFFSENSRHERRQEPYESWRDEVDYGQEEHLRDQEEGWGWNAWKLWG